MCGWLSVSLLRPADPKDKNNMLTTLRSAACSLMLLIIADSLGRSSVGVLSSSATDIEFFALTATTKIAPFSHSILGGDQGVSQYAGSPARADGRLEVATPFVSEMSRSAML